jgi:HPt (histidine-containing phosphotransfer) domain-containing protein
MATISRIRRIPGEFGASLLGQVASRFAANAGPIMAEIRAKARLGDSEAVWRGAHGLRSSAAAVGAYRVSQACAEIEALARNNDILPTETALAALEDELAAANRDLNKLVEAEEGAVDRDSFVAT